MDHHAPGILIITATGGGVVRCAAPTYRHRDLVAPPGSAKSTYVSVLLPSWYLANHPTKSILAATHSVEFAERWGRRVRNDIAHDTKTLGIELARDAKQPRDGALQAGASTMALALASAFLAFGLILVWATISSEVVRTLTQRR
jgi:hypothetical protein